MKENVSFDFSFSGYGHYLHDLIMDDLELGPRIGDWEDDVICSFGLDAWLREVNP